MRHFKAIHLILIIGMVIGFCSCCGDDEERGIEGKVRDEKNEGLEATISIRGPESQSKTADSDGSFRFEDIEAGTYTISATKEDYEYFSGAKEVTVPDDGFANADITLAKENSQTIGGVVQDATTGNPIANAQLTTNPITGSITSDDNGSYRFGEKLDTGTYTVTAKADGYEDAKISVKVVLGEPARADISMTPLEPRIRLTPKDRLDFGGSSISKILAIANIGTGNLVWQISAPTEGWLNLSGRQGNTGDTPFPVNVTVDREPIKDKPGTHQMELKITSNDKTNPTLTLIVTVDVATNPLIRVSPQELDFGNSLTALDLTIENIGTGTLTWELNIPEKWVFAEPRNGETRKIASTVTISIDRGKADVGKHPFTISVTSDGGNEEISVNMEKLPTPILSVSHEPINFGVDAENLQLTIRNAGTGNLNWRIESPTENWLDVVPKNGTADQTTPDVVTLTANRFGIASGEHFLALKITSNGGSAEISVSIKIPEKPPVLNVALSMIDFGTEQVSKNLTIKNDGMSELNYKISIPESWATANPSSDTIRQTPSAVKITIDRDSLDAGRRYEQVLTVISNGGNAEIKITAEEPPEPPVLNVSNVPINFGTEQVSKNLTIKNDGMEDLNYKISVPSEGWLEVSRWQGVATDVASSTINLTVDRTGVDVGTHNLTLTITSNGGSAEISVSMKVDKPMLSVDTKRLNFDPFTDTKTLTISREGFSEIDFEIERSQNWLKVSPEFGKLGEEEVELIVSIARSELPQGESEGGMVLSSDSAENSPVEISVTVEVLPTFRLIIRDARTGDTIRDAVALDQSSDSNGLIELKNVEGTVVSGTIMVDGFIDRDFEQQLDLTTEQIIEQIEYLTPIPHSIGMISDGSFDLPGEIALSGNGAFAYVTNNWVNSVTKISTNADAVVDTLDLSDDGNEPMGVAVHSTTGEIYVANSFVEPVGGDVQNDTISIIPELFDRSSNVTVGNKPVAIAVDELNDQLFVTNSNSGDISVIDLTNRTVGNIPVDESPGRMAVVGGELYVVTENSVIVIDTSLRQVTTTIPNVGLNPIDLAAATDGHFVYVVNNGSGDLSVVDTAGKNVVQELEVGPLPVRICVAKAHRYGAGDLIYVVNHGNSTITMIEQIGDSWQVAEEMISVGLDSQGIAVLPDGFKIYVVLQGDGAVEVLGF